jgi:hypothetical protein
VSSGGALGGSADSGLSGSSGGGGALQAGDGGSSGGGTGTGGASSGGATSTGGASSGGASASSGGTTSGGASNSSGGTSSGGAATGGVPGTGCGTPGAPSTCGNGTIEPGEQCDGKNLRGITCKTLDPVFTGGTLACDPATCGWNTSQCAIGKCGNGVVDPGEDCEPQLWYGTNQICSDYLPGSNGALVECDYVTCKYNFRNCAGGPPQVCGDGVLESGEQCDGNQRLARDCIEYNSSYTGGTLGCNPATCQFDLTQCVRCDGSRCGDGVRDPQWEQCDTTPTETCADVNRLFGQTTCNSICNNDTSKCTGGCTLFNGQLICN